MADLFKYGGFARQLIPLLVDVRGAKDRRPTIKQLPLPLADLRGMEVVLTGQVIDGFGALCCFQRHLKHEVRAVAFAFG